MMTPEMTAKLKRSLLQHEGCRNFPYVDTVGKITIGIGYNLSDRGLDDVWVDHQYEQDVNYFFTRLNSEYPWFANLNEDRQIVLIDMCFMGFKRFQEFIHMIDALSQNDYVAAANAMLDSEWAHQVAGRARELAHGMLTGVYTI
jgi:lysozyme